MHCTRGLALLCCSVLVGCAHGEQAPASQAPQEISQSATQAISVTTLPIATTANWTDSLQGSVLDELSKELESWSEGMLTIAYYDQGQVGTDPELMIAVQKGTLPIISSVSAAQVELVPQAALFGAPGILSDIEVFNEVMKGPYGEGIRNAYRAQGLELLACFAADYRILLTGTPVSDVPDFWGMRIRTLNNRYDCAYWSTLGADVLHMDFGELYLALQTNVIDAMENPLGVFPSSRLIELRWHIVMTNHALSVNMFVMNGDAYRALSEGHRDLLQQLMRKNAEQMVPRTAEDNRRLLQVVERTHGVEIHRLSDEVREQLTAAGGSVVELLREDLGDALVDEFLQAVAEAERVLGVA